jgi:hypothetical protein
MGVAALVRGMAVAGLEATQAEWLYDPALAMGLEAAD